MKKERDHTTTDIMTSIFPTVLPATIASKLRGGYRLSKLKEYVWRPRGGR